MAVRQATKMRGCACFALLVSDLRGFEGVFCFFWEVSCASDSGIGLLLVRVEVLTRIVAGVLCGGGDG